MAEQHTIEVGNMMIVLTGAYGPFRDGHPTGYLEALMENAPHTFRRVPAEERLTALQTT